MNDVVVSGWHNSLKKELRSSSSSIEQVSRRSEYWRKSNLDIISGFVQDTSVIDVSKIVGTYLYQPDLTICGDRLEIFNDKNCHVTSTADAIADENSFAKKLLW